MSRRNLITGRELMLTSEELHTYRKLIPKVAPSEHLLEGLVDSLLHRAPPGYNLVKEPELKEKGIASREWRP